LRIAVLGGGIVGLTTARALINRGHEVVLLDQAIRPATGASAQNGAQLSYGYVAPLASPSIPWQVPHLLLAKNSPLRLRPGFEPDAWRWCLEFLAACTRSRSDCTTRALLKLSMESHRQFERWRADVPAERIEHARQGKLVIYRSEAALDGARRQLKLQVGLGPAQEILSAAQCLEREPALDPSAPLAGGVWTPSEEVADCAKVCSALAEQLASHPRFSALWEHRFVRWERRDGKIQGFVAEHSGQMHAIGFDACVVAAGAQTAQVLRPLGVRVPIQPLKGYSIDVGAEHIERMPATSLTDTSIKTVFAPIGAGPSRRLRVAGFAELVGQDLRIDQRRIDRLVETVRTSFGLRSVPANVHPWAGLRPATPTSLPCIGRAGALSNVFVNAGQGALGFTLAFGSAELLAADLEGRGRSIEISTAHRAELAGADA
jgi:D-amino-acid dehydrogenase